MIMLPSIIHYISLLLEKMYVMMSDKINEKKLEK